MNQADHGDANQYRERAVVLAIRKVADGGAGSWAPLLPVPVLGHGQRLTGAPRNLSLVNKMPNWG
jgi:hypothetical protein